VVGWEGQFWLPSCRHLFVAANELGFFTPPNIYANLLNLWPIAPMLSWFGNWWWWWWWWGGGGAPFPPSAHHCYLYSMSHQFTVQVSKCPDLFHELRCSTCCDASPGYTACIIKNVLYMFVYYYRKELTLWKRKRRSHVNGYRGLKF
jgi:hypothetical protein